MTGDFNILTSRVQQARPVPGEPEVGGELSHEDGLAELAVPVGGQAVVPAQARPGSDGGEWEGVMLDPAGHHKAGLLSRQEGLLLAR